MADIPWTWLAIRGTGLTAWGLLTAVVVWGILLKTQILGRLAQPMRLLDLHRWLGAIALLFLLAHMALLLIDPAVKFTLAQILIPGTAPWETFAVALGTIGFWLLVPVSILGRIRAKLGQTGNRWFKNTHLLAYAAWPVATAHYVLAGTDAMAQWSLALLFAGTALVVMGLLARGFVPAPGPTRPVAGSTPERLTSA